MIEYALVDFHIFRTTREDRSKMLVVQNMIRKKYQELGPMTFHELATLILFILCVLLWFFRDPQFITGWSELLHELHSVYVILHQRS